jgi:hypothetical protein
LVLAVSAERKTMIDTFSECVFYLDTLVRHLRKRGGCYAICAAAKFVVRGFRNRVDDDRSETAVRFFVIDAEGFISFYVSEFPIATLDDNIVGLGRMKAGKSQSKTERDAM